MTSPIRPGRSLADARIDLDQGQHLTVSRLPVATAAHLRAVKPPEGLPGDGGQRGGAGLTAYRELIGHPPAHAGVNRVLHFQGEAPDHDCLERGASLNAGIETVLPVEDRAVSGDLDSLAVEDPLPGRHVAGHQLDLGVADGTVAGVEARPLRLDLRGDGHDLRLAGGRRSAVAAGHGFRGWRLERGEDS